MSNNAVVVYDRGERAIATLWDDQQISIRSTLPPEETLRIKEQAEPLEGNGDKPILIKGVVQHLVDMPDKDGVLQSVVRTIIVTPDGKGYACMSNGVVDSLKDFKYIRGTKPPWDPPIKAQLVIKKSRSGFRVFKLVPVK